MIFKSSLNSHVSWDILYDEVEEYKHVDEEILSQHIQL